jgi:hypothetical protein
LLMIAPLAEVRQECQRMAFGMRAEFAVRRAVAIAQ